MSVLFHHLRRRAALGAPCPVTEERAQELLDGELAPPEADAVHTHLEHCPACRARVQRLRRFLAALRRQRRLSQRAPASLHARVRAVIAAAEAARELSRSGAHAAATGAPIGAPIGTAAGVARASEGAAPRRPPCADECPREPADVLTAGAGD